MGGETEPRNCPSWNPSQHDCWLQGIWWVGSQSETGQPAGICGTHPWLQRARKKVFLSNAKQEEINETNSISKATP
jgi:hypothetical protein